MQRFWSFLGFAEEDAVAAPGEDGEAKGRRAPVVSLHANRQMEIVVLEPRSLDDALAAAECLKARRPVIVNLRDAERDLARRIVDFICGVTYAIDGQMQRVGEEIFLFAPNTVTVTAESARDEPRGLFPMT